MRESEKVPHAVLAAGGIVVREARRPAAGGPAHPLMPDVKTVKWLPLKQAVETLTRTHERVFLANVGPVALKAARQSARDIPIETAEAPEIAATPNSPAPTARSG